MPFPIPILSSEGKEISIHTVKEMFYLTKLMPFYGDRPPFDTQSWDIFTKLAAMLGIHYKYSFTEPLTLLRDVIFNKDKS